MIRVDLIVEDNKLYVFDKGKKREVISATKELMKELKLEEEDTWNWADVIASLRSQMDTKGMDWELIEEHFKTFIEKVKGDWAKKEKKQGHIYFEEVIEIFDNRAGKL